ncbi:MAG: hypothetical protein Ct9H300mP14_12800 [Gammaproteobacteria bacterium]|nr:MAG: hypothetical protein Ct9H300mP14_12800 [Gammaproteobacteria bacterium]
MLAEKQRGAAFEAVVNQLRASGKVPMGTAGFRALELSGIRLHRFMPVYCGRF